MALMHHPELRVNTDQFVTPEVIEIQLEHGWVLGAHPDTDPDDDRAVPSVLPPATTEPAEKPAPKTRQKPAPRTDKKD